MVGSETLKCFAKYFESGYLYSTDRKTARYQLEIRIIYYKEATK